MQDGSVHSDLPQAESFARELEIPYVASTRDITHKTSNNHSDSPDTGLASAASVDLGPSTPVEVSGPTVFLSNQCEDADRDNNFGSVEAPPTITAYFQYASTRVRKSDRNRLNVLSKIVEKTGLPLDKMPLTLCFLEQQIDNFGLHERPLTFARSILIGLDRLVKENPTLQSLKYEVVEDTRIHSLPEAERPDSFICDLRVWRQSVPVKVLGKENSFNALTVRSIKNYEANAVTALSALRLSGLRFSDDCGIHFLARKEAVTIWEKLLSKCQKPKTVQGTLAGVLRIARDMNVEQSCIKFLEARLAAVMTSTEIDSERLAALAEPENYLALIEVPELLMLKAKDPKRQMFSRLSAGRSAVAFQLMWEHPDLSEQFVAQFDLKTHIGGTGNELTLLRSKDGPPERMTPVTAQLFSRFLKINELPSAPSSYLFPNRQGKLRSISSAMASVYHQIQATLLRHVTRSDLRDLNTFIALSCDNADLAAIAAGAGYKNTKSLALRFGHTAGRPKQERNE